MIRQLPRPWYALLLPVTLLLFATPAFALPTLSISSPGSDGVFVLRGEQMDGVAGLDLNVGFDSGTLGNPRVTMGRMLQGMMSAANSGNPVRMAIVGTRGLSGSGVIATIAFDRTGGSPGVITALTGTLIDAAGRKVAMTPPVVANPSVVAPPGGDQGGGTPAGDGATADSGAPGGTPGTITVPHPIVVGGTLTMPGETAGQEAAGRDSAAARENSPVQEEAPPRKKRLRTKKAQLEGEEPPLEREDNVPPPEDEPGPAPEADTPPQPQEEVSQPVQVKSVLARFEEFRGEPTAANLIPLFRQDPGLPYTQVPPVAIADGKATVALVIAMATGDATPRFTFSGCSYVSHRRNETGAWEIVARPEPGVVKADVTMLYNGFSQEFPLTVAPRVQLPQGRARPASEADFERFLKERGTPARPRHDLNRDGRRDYLDDYIFAANYLAQVGQQGP